MDIFDCLTSSLSSGFCIFELNNILVEYFPNVTINTMVINEQMSNSHVWSVQYHTLISEH
jgi:hypothetical protein